MLSGVVSRLRRLVNRKQKSPTARTIADVATPLPVKSSRFTAIEQPRSKGRRVPPGGSDLDMRGIGSALWRGRRWILIPTLLVLAGSLAAVNMVTPRYKSETRILIEGRENFFLRPNAERAEEKAALDAEAVTSQVQLVLSRDLARIVIEKNKLADLPEFDPVLHGLSPLQSMLALIGIGRDPFRLTPEERVLDAYYDRLTAYAVDKSRVIAIEFQSQDPELAAKVANSIATTYLSLQQTSKQNQTRAASQWLAGEIESLRKKVAEAESRVEEFRGKSSLFVGTNNTTLSNQQLGEINTQLTNAKAQKSDAESKAKLIRDMLQSGRPIEASEVLNSELVRRLTEQRITLQGQLAEQSSTLLDGHPRIKELKAQIADLDRQLRDEASKISRSLENDARIAGARVDSLMASFEQMKRQATSTNGQDVQLRALEREAKAQRDLLESYLAKYREATARESIDQVPTEARIISPAIVSNTPAWPKKLPIVLIATLATLLLTSGTIVSRELLRLSAGADADLTPVEPARRERIVAVAEEYAPPLQRIAEEASLVPEPEPRPEPKSEPVAATPAGVPEAVELAPAVLPVAAAEPVDPPPPAASELEHVGNRLLTLGPLARKITVIGQAGDEFVSAAALQLGRLMARRARVVLVEFAGRTPLVPALSSDPGAPGLADLVAGRAGFSELITRDRASGLHLVSAGSAGDRSWMLSERLPAAIEALQQSYDHVILAAGSAIGVPQQLLAKDAQAIVIPDPAISPVGRARMAEQLAGTGFLTVTIVSLQGSQSPAAA